MVLKFYKYSEYRNPLLLFNDNSSNLKSLGLWLCGFKSRPGTGEQKYRIIKAISSNVNRREAVFVSEIRTAPAFFLSCYPLYPWIAACLEPAGLRNTTHKKPNAAARIQPKTQETLTPIRPGRIKLWLITKRPMRVVPERSNWIAARSLG